MSPLLQDPPSSKMLGNRSNVQMRQTGEATRTAASFPSGHHLALVLRLQGIYPSRRSAMLSLSTLPREHGKRTSLRPADGAAPQ